MQYLLRVLLAILIGVFCGWIITASAQTQTTPNLITPSGTAWGIPQNQVLNNAGIASVEGVGPTTGSAYYNSDTNTIRFSYWPSTVAQTIAINQALEGTGIKVTGFNWSYLWMNGGYSSGTLSGSITMTKSNGAIVESQTFNHPVQPTDTWNVESGTRTFNNPYTVSSLGTLTMSFTGQDNRYWNGLYGPRVRDPSLSLNYGVDQCTANPLSSPDCPGYATAYFNQQCTISALYNPSCPGYAQAYYTQQCSLNPLYDPGCPGYQQAYFDYQCQQNGLYSTSCPNYAEAYAKKQLLTQSSATDTTTSTGTTTTAKTDPVAIATTSTTTSTTSPTSVTSVTSVISGGTSSATTTTITAPNTVQSTPTQTAPASTTDAKTTSAEIKSASSGSSGAEEKSRTEARAKEIAKASSEAKTLEAQAATQGLVVGLMGFVPGFDAYSSAKIVDVNALDMQRRYSRPVVDNRSALRQLNGASDQLHREMVDQQYGR